MSLKTLFVLLSFIHFINSQDLPNPTFDGTTLRYSIAINLSNYLYLLSQNNSAVENKTIYDTQSSLSGSKGGIVKGTIYEVLARDRNIINNYTLFNTYEEAQLALHNHSIDYFICYKETVGDEIQMYTENLTNLNIDAANFSSEYISAFVMNPNQSLFRNQTQNILNSGNYSILLNDLFIYFKPSSTPIQLLNKSLSKIE